MGVTTNRNQVAGILAQIKRNGLAVVLLVVLLVWLAPKLDRLFDAHLQFMQRTSATQSKQAETQAVGIEVLRTVSTRVEDTHGMVRDLHRHFQGPQVGHVDAPEPQPRPEECGSEGP